MLGKTEAKLVDTVGNSNSENDPIEIVFVEDLPRELQCKKCNQVLRIPQKLECGHRLCATCVEGLHTCPECSALISHDKVCAL